MGSSSSCTEYVCPSLSEFSVPSASVIISLSALWQLMAGPSWADIDAPLSIRRTSSCSPASMVMQPSLSAPLTR